MTPGGFLEEKEKWKDLHSSGDRDAGQQEGFHGGGEKHSLFLGVHRVELH